MLAVDIDSSFFGTCNECDPRQRFLIEYISTLPIRVLIALEVQLLRRFMNPKDAGICKDSLMIQVFDLK
jgi:hypothetical protein